MKTQEQLAQQLANQSTQLDGITAQVGKIGTDNVSPALQAAADLVDQKIATLADAVNGLVPATGSETNETPAS